jgi:hypothetical protein
MHFERDAASKKRECFVYNMFVFVGIQRACRIYYSAAWLCGFDGRDKELKLCSCNLIYFFSFPKTKCIVRFVSCSFAATWCVYQDMIKKVWEILPKTKSVEVGDCSVVASSLVEVVCECFYSCCVDVVCNHETGFAEI